MRIMKKLYVFFRLLITVAVSGFIADGIIWHCRGDGVVFNYSNAIPGFQSPSYKGKTVEQWAKLLEDSDNKKRIQALKALNSIGPKAKIAIPALIRFVKDSKRVETLGRETDRMAAVRLLGEFDPEAKTVLPVLIELLKDP